MRIVGGAWRGRRLVAPAGEATRPTADRVRQALFDMLMHAGWGGRAVIEDAVVLDAFAGTGALGLEALSHGAACACFVEADLLALRALRANVAACRAEAHVSILPTDLFALQRDPRLAPASLVFLDPPYGDDRVPQALAHLTAIGCVCPGALIVAETARADPWRPDHAVLAERSHGAARLLVFRLL